MHALMASIDSQPCEQNNGQWLSTRKTPRQPRGRITWHDRTSCQCVVPSYIGIRLGRDEHTGAATSVTLESMFAQPVVQRLNSASEVLGVVPRL